MKLRSLVFLGTLLLLSVGSPKAKDDCEVAWQISNQESYTSCRNNGGTDEYCTVVAFNAANAHALDIGCPPHSNVVSKSSASTEAKDDCLVAYQIAFQDAYDQCMASTTDTGYCTAQARNTANAHMLEIGCPPIYN